MALGSGTVNAKAGERPSTPTFVDDITFAGDGAYPAGGTAAFQAYVRNLGRDLRTVDAVIDINGVATHYPVYDKANDKLLVFVRTTGVEAAPGDLSAVTFRVAVISH